MADIELRSLQNIIATMAARLRAETDTNDLSDGSFFLTMIEAAASQDYQIEAKLLQLLQLRNIDKVSGVDLESLATEMGVTPSRIGASSARIQLTIKETAFSKVSSNIYAGATAPVAGDTEIKVVSASSFNASGTIYIGRGTQTSEVVNYVSVADSGSFWTISLAAPLEKDHLVGEEVVMAQGGDRTITSGIVAFAEGVGFSPAIQFTTQIDQVMRDGEDTLAGVIAVCGTPGSQGLVGKGKVSQFISPPWSSAAVTNDEPSTGGRDAETDPELRERIKDHVHNLSGGTERAILRATIGLLDDEENKRVVSAYLRKPVSKDDATILFIDDGTGFAPSFAGRGEETIVTSASGQESFFQLQKWPLLKAQIASVSLEPFNLVGGEMLYVEVDGQFEQWPLDNSSYRTPGVVKAQEVAEAINAKFTSIEARAKDGQLFIAPTADDPDWIRVGTSTSGDDANASLRFPVTRQYTLRLYKNDRLLEKNGSEALIQSLPQTEWTGINLPAAQTPTDTRETLQLRVDGIDSALVYYADIDFATYTSSDKVKNATVRDWVTMINRTFIGVTAVERDDGTFILKSNKGRTSQASLEVIGGTLATKLFAANAASIGKASEYKINRLTGQLELTEALAEGDELKAGTVNTRGFALTDAQASFNLDLIGTHQAEMVIITDGPYIDVPVFQGNTINFSIPSTGTQRITGQPGQFSEVKVDDWAHLYNCPRHGVLRVKAVGSSGDYVDFYDPQPQSGSVALNGVTSNITFFRTEGLPQRIKLPSGNAVLATVVTSSLNDQLLGGFAEILDSGAIKIQTTRYLGTGALAIPSVSGTARNLGIQAGNFESNDPHLASIESADLTGIASQRLTVQSNDNSEPYTTFNTAGSTLTKENSNRPLMAYLGSTSRFLRQPEEKSTAAQLILREELPNISVGLGPDLKAASLSGLEFGQADNMVFLIDNDPTRKTFDVPLYVDAEIVGPSVPTASEFDAKDLTGALLGSSSRWLGHRFEDYRAWFQAWAKMPFSAPNSQLKIKSLAFGPNGEKIRVGFIYPTRPDQPAAAQFDVDALNDLITVSVALQSGAERTFNLQPNRRVDVEIMGSNQKIHFLPPVDLTPVLPGDVVSILDSNSTNQGTMKVSSVSQLVDVANAFEHTLESFSADVTGATNLQWTGALTQQLQVGDLVKIGSTTRAITNIVAADEFQVAAPGFSDGASQAATVQHKSIKAFNNPSFSVAVGDRIVAGGFVLKVTSIIGPQEYNVDTPFQFNGLLSGTISRIYLAGSKFNGGSSETFLTQSSQSIRVFELPSGDNSATTILTLINNTAGVKDLIEASNAAPSTGAGDILKSTEDELGNGQKYVTLRNGEDFIYSCSNSSPALRLKSAIAQAPEIGDKVRLYPMTPRNVADHFRKKQISGLTVAAQVDLVDQGRRVQVSTRTPGGIGQVFAVGGRASGANVLSIRANAQEMTAQRAQIELDRSSIELLAPGQTIKIAQTSRAKKRYPVSNPTAGTTMEIQIPAAGQGKLLFSIPLVKLYTYTQTGTVKWAVRNIGRNRTRFEIISGTASVPSGLLVDDWVLIGNGSSYAGITTDSVFAPANQGWFQVRETDNSTYFDVEGQGFEEFVTTTVNSFVFCSYHSVRPGDQLVIGFDAPVLTVNKGTFEVLTVPSTTQITYTNPLVETQAPVALGTAGISSISVLDQGYSTYRKVVMVAPKPSDPTGRALLVVSPGYDLSVVSEGQGGKITLPNRLNFGTDPVPGVNGYSYWTGLLRRVHRVVNGYEPDSANFPGTAAYGIGVEPKPPQKKSVAVAVKVKTANGVSLQSLSDTIKSVIAGYINSLGLGQDVVLSEIIRLTQEVPGVEACVLVTPEPDTERITVNDNAIARISVTDISLS